MSLHSIYSKTCPQCAQTVARDAGRCACGHVFVGDDPAGALVALQTTLKEEQLYADYLAARARQAAQAAVVAQSVHAANPGDANKGAEARRALEAAEAARAESVSQQARVTALMQALTKVQPSVSHSAVPQAPRTPPSPHVSVRTAPVERPRPPSPSAPARPAMSAPAGAGMKSCPLCTARVKADVMACTCGFSFRPAQLDSLDTGAVPGASRAAADSGRARLAREAERALQRARAAKVASDDAAAAGRARLAREAERALGRAQAAKPRQCPHCTASVPANAARCGCGHVFEAGRAAPMPGLALDPAEQAKLTDLLKRK